MFLNNIKVILIIFAFIPGLIWGQDVTPPAAPERLFATPGNGTVTLNWDSNSEADFGKYNIYGGISSAPTTVVASILTIGETTITISGLDNDITYYYRLSALDITGNVSAFSNEASATPFSPPVASDIRDGSSTDVDWWNDRSTFTLNWDPFEDNGAVTYKYAIGTSLGNLNSIVDWTANGTETSVTLTNPIFFEGFTYYMSVKGTDNTSKSDIATSDGVKMDFTAPISGVVNDGSTEEGIDLEFGNTLSELSANWSSFIDPPVNGAGSGIAAYSYAIDTVAKKAEIVPWTEIGLNKLVSHEELILEEGVPYYFSVIAIDGAGNSSRAISSNGVIKDFTSPLTGDIIDLRLDDFLTDTQPMQTYFEIANKQDRDWINSGSSIAAYWSRFKDELSGIDYIQFSLLDINDAAIVDWSTPETDSTTRVSNISLDNNEFYYFSVRAFDVAGNVSKIQSNGVRVDLTPPSLLEKSSERLYLNDLSEASITFNEPILSLNITASGERTETVKFVSDLKEDILFISVAPPLVSMDSLTFLLTGVTDTHELVTDNIRVGFNTRLLGDYDNNQEIDIGDITQFVTLWPNTDIAPVTGEPPYFYSTPDEVTDLRDAMAFARLWRWSNEPIDTSHMAAFQMGEPLDTRIISGGFSVTLPRTARSGEIEIQSQSRIRLTNSETSENGLFLSRLNASGKHQIINFGLFREPAERSHSELNFSVDDPAEKIDFSYRFFGSSGNLISSGSVSLFDSPHPSQFALHQNSPNPFNPVTTIAFNIPEPTYVEIAIYDLLGSKVRTLVSKEMSPGFHSAVWNGKDDRGRLVASGMFIVRMTSSSFMDVKKMLMLK